MAMGLVLPDGSLAQRLPVFKLAQPKADRGRAIGILNKAHKGRPPKMEARDRPDALVQRAGKKEVEISKESGGIFFRDVERLWNPKIKRALPSKAQAKVIAEKFLTDNQLFPRSGPHHKVGFDGTSETAFASQGPDGKVGGKTVMDVQANFKVDVSVKGPDGKMRLFPIVGGGGKFKVAVGDRGEVVGFQGVWRPVTEVASMEEIIPRGQAITEFKKTAGKVNITKTDAYLAYHQSSWGKKQSIMAPVWVVKAEANIDGQAVPIRNRIIAATKYGPKRKKVVPPKPRDKGAQPLQRSLDQDEKGGHSMIDLLIPPAYADPAYEVGASWLYTEAGLPGCKDVGNGFVNGLKAAGWQVNFNWGGRNAYESDWRRNDDLYVDAADFVFYCGHASMNGWSFHRPDDTSLHYSEVGSTPRNPSDLWGQQDLEWITIAACGPLQDSHFVSGGGNAFSRWDGAFDGLHILLGYGAVTFDNDDEGWYFAYLLRLGWKVIDAWFRTAWVVQPSWNGYSPPNGPRVYVAAMYAHKGDHATRHDRIWGKGYVAPDPIAPVWLTLMWLGT